jgi:hypothetical protein
MNCPNCGTEYQVVFAGQAAPAKTKRVSTMSDEQRKAVGIRLQTARAAKMGLTLDQLRTLKIRPGQKPTAEQLAQVKGETTKATKPAGKSKPRK